MLRGSWLILGSRIVPGPRWLHCNFESKLCNKTISTKLRSQKAAQRTKHNKKQEGRMACSSASHSATGNPVNREAQASTISPPTFDFTLCKRYLLLLDRSPAKLSSICVV